MNQIPNIEEVLAKKLHALETDWLDGCYIRGEDVDEICDYVHHQLQKAREEERERVLKELGMKTIHDTSFRLNQDKK